MTDWTEPIPGYEVTADGRVFSKVFWRGQRRREMAQQFDQDGYRCVRLTLAGKRKKFRTHRLVARKFLPQRPHTRDAQLRHLDGNKTNNDFKNLCWGTAKDNAADRDIHGRTSCGEPHKVKTIEGQMQSQSPYFRHNRAALAKARGESE